MRNCWCGFTMGFQVIQGVHCVLVANCPRFRTDLVQHNRNGIFSAFQTDLNSNQLGFFFKTPLTDPIKSWYWRKKSWEKLVKFSVIGRIMEGLGGFILEVPEVLMLPSVWHWELLICCQCQTNFPSLKFCQNSPRRQQSSTCGLHGLVPLLQLHKRGVGPPIFAT